MSRSLKEVTEGAAKYHSELKAGDPRFMLSVRVSTEEGSYFNFAYAFAQTVDDKWLVVFTEHHGFHVFNENDLESYDVARPQVELPEKAQW
jgi:hypothetical protein